MKRRAKKRRRALPPARGPFDLGGVPVVGMAHPLGSTRPGRGRLGRAMRAATSKLPAPADKQQAAVKALARWENEGGRPAPRATSKHPTKIKATHPPKKSVAKHSAKKAKPKRKPA